MERIVLIALMLSSIHLTAQDSLSIEPTLHKINFGNSLTINNVRLEFSELSADSRCPKEAMCVRAGEAIAKVKVYINNTLKKEVELIFYPHGVIDSLATILSKENIEIQNLELGPYPNVGERIPINTYYLQFKRYSFN